MFLGVFDMIWRSFFSLLPLGLPGGYQVDGLPPAASTDPPAASWPAPTATELIANLGFFFEKDEFFCH